MGLGIVRCLLDCFENEFGSFFVVTALMSNHTQKVQCIRLLRIVFEYAAVK